MSQGAFSGLGYYSAPFRRFGASTLARFVVLAVGLMAMAALTVPDPRVSWGILISLCLWCCLAYFATETAVRADRARHNGALQSYLISLTGIVDLAGVIPVPIALVCG